MQLYTDQAVEAVLRPAEGRYLQTRYYLKEEGPALVTVGRGENWSPLACKEVYAQAVRTAGELERSACAADLTAAAELGFPGLCAALEGLYGGGYKIRSALTGDVEPETALYAQGKGFTPQQLQAASEVARSVIQARNLVNRPGNLLDPAGLAGALREMAEGLPVTAEIYGEEQLDQLGLQALLSVAKGGGGAYLAVLRYTGAPRSGVRLGFVGKGITCDTGGYCVKSGKSMAGMKGDMAGAAAAACALRALAANGAKVNVTAVIPICANRISREGTLPGDVIGSLSGKTIEVLNTDAEGRLILADGLTWAIEKESCTHLVDIATLTGAIHAMLGNVATGVMAVGEDWYARLVSAAEKSGERFWRMPDFPEYEKLIDSPLADVRNTSRDGCGAITAGLFLKRFTQGLPWMHLDIAGAADVTIPVWKHQVKGATGAAVTTLYHLAADMEEQ